MQQERWILLGFAVLLALLLIAWWVAATLNGSNQFTWQIQTSQIRGESKGIQISVGQLVAEIPEREERWVLQFASSHYDSEQQVATTKNGVCKVTRGDKIVTVFHAPTIKVRFKEREMEMSGGVTVVATLPRLKVNLESLQWRWESGELVGIGKVKIEGERLKAVADRLEGDTTLQRISLIGNIRTEVIEAKSGERR
ncbi:MAG: hypothetical protein N2116_01405 [Armatimonadetes bacterium]|nr:hypothetical protein [Armatimonadota bacterium]